MRFRPDLAVRPVGLQYRLRSHRLESRAIDPGDRPFPDSSAPWSRPSSVAPGGCSDGWRPPRRDCVLPRPRAPGPRRSEIASPVIAVMSASETEPMPPAAPTRARPSDVRYDGSSVNPRCMLLRMVSSVPRSCWRARNLIPPFCVLRGLRDVGLNPEERPVEAHVGLAAKELAVEVDADLEPRVVGHHLNSGRATQRVADDPDALSDRDARRSMSSARVAGDGSAGRART